MVKKTANWIKNISKLAFHFASQAFPVMDSLIIAVKETVSVLVHRIFPGSNPAILSIRHDLDFDFTFFYNQSVEAATYQPLLTKFQNKASIFQIGIEIMANLIDMLIEIGRKLISGAVGWLRFIIALVHSIKQLRQLGLLVERIVVS